MPARRIKATQIAGVRQSMLDAQGGRCALCHTPTASSGACLDHDHTTGFLRAVLCRNCNGIEGKIKNLARRGQRKYDHKWFIARLLAYWEEHDDAIPEHGLIHPTFKSDEEKRLRTNKMARARRAATKKD